MKSIYAKTFDRKAYAQYLASQYHIFRELEALSDVHQKDWPLPAVYDQLLHRTQSLEKDLEFWHGADWRQFAAIPSAQTLQYLQQLRVDSGDAWLLLCHHFLQYNAVLSGGQFLGGMVSERAAASGAGAAFYDFPQECLPTHARVQRYIEAVDGLELSAELRDRMLACMRCVYSQLLALFDEAHAVAPMEGVSYQASKAAAAGSAAAPTGSPSAGGGGPKVPPPPLEPLGRDFTPAEMLEHDGQQEGRPILTSVLGRVYDVTIGKEFFGRGGPYEMFAGHDGTYNLAVMSLKKQTLDKFEYELDDEDKECLADWIAYFDNRYSRPIGKLNGKQHSVSLRDLPRAKKIPFSDMGGEDDPPAAAPAATSRL